MNKSQILKINKLTKEFYSKKAVEFSATRQNSWHGWEKIAPVLQDRFKDGQELYVLDAGCGNLRFAKFLSSAFPNSKIIYVGIDVCEDLQNLSLPDNIELNYSNIDFVEALVEDSFKSKLSDTVSDSFDIVVSFGVMHHIPTLDLQSKFVSDLSSFMDDHGLSIISYWQFMNDEKIAKKAIQATDFAQQSFGPFDLDKNDYFLNWAEDTTVLRFCHNYSTEDIEYVDNQLFVNHGIKCIKNVVSDGKNDNLNYYSIYSK